MCWLARRACNSEKGTRMSWSLATVVRVKWLSVETVYSYSDDWMRPFS